MNSLKSFVVLALVALSGCSTIYFDNGTRGRQGMEYSEWHHDGVFGLVEFSPAVDMANRCEGKAWQSVRVERTFLQGLAGSFTYSLYDPWDVAYSCQQ